MIDAFLLLFKFGLAAVGAFIAVVLTIALIAGIISVIYSLFYGLFDMIQKKHLNNNNKN